MDIVYSSEEQSESDQEEEFIYHKPSTTHSKKGNQKNEEDIYQIKKDCEFIKNEILQRKLTQTAKHICKTIFSSEKEQLIIPLLFKRNQHQDLQQIISYISQKLESLENKETSFFQNRCKKFNIHKLMVNDIKSLILKIYMTDYNIRTKDDIVVYIPKEICDLTPENIYLLEQGLQGCCYKVIIPTYSDFLSYPYSPQNKMELIPHTLYNNKELFCQFMYRCIVDEKVKAYLPKQSFSLVTDFDEYPISFHEGCRRLIFCIVKYRLLLEERDLLKKIEFVSIGLLFLKLQQSIGKIFKVFSDFKKEKLMEKNIKCILDERDVYGIFQQYLNKMKWFAPQKKDQIDVICDVRRVIIEKFKQQKDFKKFIPILQNLEPENKTVVRIKKQRREDKFGIDPNLNKSEKDILQDQLTKIIKIHTQRIRFQSKWIKWQQIDFQNKIRPEIPLHIFNTVFETSNKRKILNEITSYPSVSLVRLIHKFCEEENYGEFMYNMKDLQLFGLIDIVRSNINPTVTPYFFSKSSFSRVKQENDY